MQGSVFRARHRFTSQALYRVLGVELLWVQQGGNPGTVVSDELVFSCCGQPDSSRISKPMFLVIWVGSAVATRSWN